MDLTALADAERRLEFDGLALAIAGRIYRDELPPDDAYHWTIVLCVMYRTHLPPPHFTRPETP